MWCRDCQQDVPAVARAVDGPLVCSRCEAEFEVNDQFASSNTQPADTGVELESLDRRSYQEVPPSPWQRDETTHRLRRIGQQLRTAYRHETQLEVPAPPRIWGPENLDAHQQRPRLQAVGHQAHQAEWEQARSTVATRLISLLLFAGVLGFAMGVGLLVWAAAFGLPASWQWGMTATIAAEGTLIVGLVWMAARLWNNSRRLNRQIDGVDRQLHDLERLTGALSASRLSSSQHYYEHFHQGASDHMLLANLHGQVDQLSSRLAG